ncbi:MAG TPA: phosphate ABC transporter substrate-binding protein PstS [Planctomycetota bacterium]|nr:phosphate ABC transporter substrate-binding protein PstS [Planctomycetota bacterium]
MTLIRWAACGLAAAGFLATETRLQGAGATFPAPLYARWVAEYGKLNPSIAIDYQAIGSGGGIKSITDKTVDFAGSDAPLNDKQIQALGQGNVIHVPSCAGGVVPAYNLPGLGQDLNFTGEVLAEIYMGKITRWNDAKIAAVNAGSSLPDTVITTAWRTDGSGTNFVWTNYLSTQNEAFKESIGMGTSVKWPVGQGGKGNAGITAIVQQTKGAIGYTEQNYASENKLTYGKVKNLEGEFIKASPESISLAGVGAVGQLQGDVLKANLWNQPGKGTYPIASFTYLIAYRDLNNLKSREQAQALVDYFWWATHEGQQYANKLEYAPLAPDVQHKVGDALGHFTYKGEALKPKGS